ncbi:MAG: hypothetical protein IIC01_07730, partial [Planctomycetes bacterium]|nr:hypothetical protein [Planctomycetota bacterium]
HYNAGAHHLDVLNGGFLAEHYLLHGDEGSLDVLKEIFLYLQGTWKRHFDARNGGVNTTLTCAVPDIGNALFIAGAYEAANGINDGNAITMANYVLATARARQSNVTPNDPSGNGFADTTGSFKSWQAGHLVEGLVYCRWQLNDPTIEQNTLDAMNWLLGANASVYLGNLPTPLWGKFAESPGGTVDMGGTALMLGAGYAAAYRKSLLVNWVNAALNLLQEQTNNILPATVGDSGIRHSTFGQYFRAGPALLATLQP